MQFLIIGDVRCGGTMLSRTLNSHPHMSVADEPLLRVYMAGGITQADFEDMGRVYDGFRVQRSYFPKTIQLGDIKVINLYRRDKLAQYLSFKLALHTGGWTERREPDRPIRFNSHAYSQAVSEWKSQKESMDRRIAHLDVYELAYEDIVDHLGRIQDFLGVARCELSPAMKRLDPVDYSRVFDGLTQGVN